MNNSITGEIASSGRHPVEATKHHAQPAPSPHHPRPKKLPQKGDNMTLKRVMVVPLLALVLVPVAQAAPIPTLPPDIKRCVLSPSLGTGLRTSKIVAGLGLPPDVVRDVRTRLGSYGGATGFEGLDGLGLTAEQGAVIQRRLELQVTEADAKPVGWPCSPFGHRAKTVAFVRSKLLAEGFDPEMTFGTSFPRQIHFHGMRDGVATSGMVVVLGTRKLGMVWRVFGTFGWERWTVPFAP